MKEQIISPYKVLPIRKEQNQRFASQSHALGIKIPKDGNEPTRSGPDPVPVDPSAFFRDMVPAQ